MNKSKSYHGSSPSQFNTIGFSSEFNYNQQTSLKKRSSPSITSAIEFLSFKWLFKRKHFHSKSAKLNRHLLLPPPPPLRQQQRQPGTATRITKVKEDKHRGGRRLSSTLRQSYSFDDVDKFLKLAMSNNESATKDYSDSESDDDYEDDEDDEDDDDDDEYCSLCLSRKSKEEMHSMRSCGCKYCKSCLKQFLTINIKENNDVTFLNCPDANCPQSSDGNNLISVEEIEMFVDKQTYKLYRKFKIEWEVDNDPNRTWCPTPNCDNICTLTKSTITSIDSLSSVSIASTTSSTRNTARKEKLPFYCHRCDRTFCSHCRRWWHPGFPCQSTSEDDNLMLLLERNESSKKQFEIKRCPRCSVWIERDEGCAQMMCRKCKHVFCWFCLQSLEDDFLLRHYDKGPCKNKLGHSRASVIWHRTQVISIFAGFGFLLLLASPLFLLAAPCILCCNCCCASSCKYMDDVDLDPPKGGTDLSPSSVNDDFLFDTKQRTKL